MHILIIEVICVIHLGGKAMREFSYTIKDKDGIHARPAGMLVKKASEFSSDIMIEMNGSSKNMKRIFSVMSLGAKQGDTVRITASGSDESEAVTAISDFLENNL